MRLVLHRRIRSDVDRSWTIISRPSIRNWLLNSTANYAGLCWMLRGVPADTTSSRGDLRRANLKRFPYHFCIASLATASASSSSGTTAAIPITAWSLGGDPKLLGKVRPATVYVDYRRELKEGWRWLTNGPSAARCQRHCSSTRTSLQAWREFSTDARCGNRRTLR